MWYKAVQINNIVPFTVVVMLCLLANIFTYLLLCGFGNLAHEGMGPFLPVQLYHVCEAETRY